MLIATPSRSLAAVELEGVRATIPTEGGQAPSCLLLSHACTH